MLRQDGLDLLSLERELFKMMADKLDAVMAKLDGVGERLGHLEDVNSLLKVFKTFPMEIVTFLVCKLK